MAMSFIWTGMVLFSLLFALPGGCAGAVSAAALEGAASGVRLSLSLAGTLCLWSGLVKVMEQARLDRKLARLLSPLLRRLFPQAGKDEQTMGRICANVSANLLGLGNAATPLGIEAVRRMKGGADTASNELCGDEHSLHPASAHHGGCPARDRRRGISLRYLTGRMGHLPLLGIGRSGGGLSLPADLEDVMAELLIPLFMVGVSVAALSQKQDVYSALLDGGRDGLRILLSIVPALVMLLAAVHMLRASGAINALSALLAPLFRLFGIPPETAPLVLPI